MVVVIWPLVVLLLLFVVVLVVVMMVEMVFKEEGEGEKGCGRGEGV